MEAIVKFINDTGFVMFFQNEGWKNLIMLLVACFLLYLGIGKKFEPLLMVPIAFGMLMTNLPGAGMFNEIFFAGGHIHWDLIGGAPVTAEFLAEMEAAGVLPDVLEVIERSVGQTITPGLIDILYLGVKLGIYPCLIFMGVGAMTDFGPLIANPKSLLLGAAAQVGIFLTYVGARFLGFTGPEASSIGIIGGADGPTAIFVTVMLAPALLGPIAVSAYSYMALVPVIQPPIMKLLTTEKERQIVMKPLREVSKLEKIVFPIVVTIFVALLVPSAAPLIAALMLGNLFSVCGVTDRLSKTAQNELANLVTILLGITIGGTMVADKFLNATTLLILALGLFAFIFDTAGGVLFAKFLNIFRKKKINPMVGAAGISAFPMSSRVIAKMALKEDPSNFILMQSTSANVSGQLGSIVAGGMVISLVSMLIGG